MSPRMSHFQETFEYMREKHWLHKPKTTNSCYRFRGFWVSEFRKLGNWWKPANTRNLFWHSWFCRCALGRYAVACNPLSACRPYLVFRNALHCVTTETRNRSSTSAVYLKNTDRRRLLAPRNYTHSIAFISGPIVRLSPVGCLQEPIWRFWMSWKILMNWCAAPAGLQLQIELSRFPDWSNVQRTIYPTVTRVWGLGFCCGKVFVWQKIESND